MNYSEFYVISEKHIRGAINLVPKLPLETDIDQLFRGGIKNIKKVKFMKYNGSKELDVLNSGFPGVFVVSFKVIDLLKFNDVTGWGSIPISIQEMDGLNYYLLTILGKSGGIDMKKCKTFLKEPYSPTGKPIEAKKGLFFDLNSWDGSEIFSPENSRFIFCTEKVKRLFDKNRISNVIFENITQFEIF